eukprot:CAMPEP_0172323728 /NCGR_PEP_ID=MMETSP1058-20130122/49451_1 /TAXON_ID=83371 /ORGANISM="Detonula confervacea, Strain CCMP 353" /LENGTH=270 /DNA_ID=CAMNT_0013039805 /DNA_START=152 /DNA_END=964 /DNA_ORIENTATION=-
MVAVYTTTGALCLCILFSCAAAFSPSPATSSTLLTRNNNNPIQSRAIQDNNIMNSMHHRGDVPPRPSTQLYNLFPKDDLFPKDEFDKKEDDFLDDGDDDFDYDKYEPAVAAQIRKAKQLISDAKKTQKANEEKAAKAEAAAEAGETETVSKEEEEGSKKTLPFFAAAPPADNSKKIKSKTASGDIIADGETMASLSKSEPWERRPLSQMFDRESGIDYDGNVVDNVPMDPGRVLADRDVNASIYNLRKSLQTADFMKVFDKRNRFIGDLD